MRADGRRKGYLKQRLTYSQILMTNLKSNFTVASPPEIEETPKPLSSSTANVPLSNEVDGGEPRAASRENDVEGRKFAAALKAITGRESSTTTAAPLFSAEHKIAYDHDIFSQNGAMFSYGLNSIERSAIPVLYDLISRTYPAKAKSLKNFLVDYWGAEEARLALEPKNFPIPPKTRRNKKPKAPNALRARWDQVKITNKSTLVDTQEGLAAFMEILKTVEKHEFELFCDCEGDNLGREGTLSLLQIMIASKDYTWVLDITILKEKAFDTKWSGPAGRSLRHIFEDSQIPKM